jgi:Cu+-exporting ATPase
MVSGLPESAIWIDKDGKEQKISAEKILKNHKLKLLPGMRLPVDAIIMDYSVNIDESVLTGESEPTLKHQGDTIYAGSISVESPVICVALNSYHESSLSSLKKRLENLSFEKSNLQVFTEKLSHAFLYIVLIIAAGSFAYWYFSTGSLEQAITTAVAVLIVACPCALGIAVPAALVTNHILNSEKGILLKNPSVVDSLDKATVFCFDKTGTLTEGKMKVVGEFLPKDVSLEAIYLAAKQSNHPASRAVAEYLEKKVNKNYIPFFSIVNTKNNTGMGTCTLVHTSWGQVEVKLGNSKHCHIDSISEKAVYFSMREKKGYFILEEKVRENAKTLIDNLKKKNKKIIMLSGDSKDSVEKVAKELGIENYYFDMKPEDKVKIIDDLNSKGERPAMVGDGLNDTLSLTKAGVGITHGLAEDLSLEKSDVILIRPEMENLIKALDYSKLTRRVVRENIAISLTYNSIMIPLAAFGLMLPVICAAFMSTSSLTVLTNSILLYRRAKKI